VTASTTIVGILVGYLAVLLGIGIWGGRGSGDVKGYYVAGKRLPSWVIAFSSNSTGESAWLLLGLTGMGYAVGIHAFWVVLGEVLGVTLAWVFVARPSRCSPTATTRSPCRTFSPTASATARTSFAWSAPSSS
jgi:Na+/proline symporter